MKIYLDAIEPAPEEWIGIHTAQETIELLKTGKVKELNLSYSFFYVLLWIKEQLLLTGDDWFVPNVIKIHDEYPSNREKLQKCLDEINQKRIKIKYENT